MKISQMENVTLSSCAAENIDVILLYRHSYCKLMKCDVLTDLLLACRVARARSS